MPLILGTNSIKDTGFDVANSCRFNDDDSAAMSKSSTTLTNDKKFTISAWVKRGHINGSDEFPIFGHISDSDNANKNCQIGFYNDALYMAYVDGGSVTVNKVTNALYRDNAAWYHVMVAVDSTQGTAANRNRFYVNGTEVTSFATDTNSGSDETFLATSCTITVGKYSNTSGTASYFDGYLAEVVYIDGLQLTPSSFGEFDEDSPTIWKPINVSGLTFGNNGFYLDFEASANLGNDANGGTDLTEANLAAVDQATDTPTNSFATMNPLIAPTSNASTFSEGNCKIVTSTGGNFGAVSTHGAASGKWYFEVKFTAESASNMGNINLCSSENGRESARTNQHSNQFPSEAYPSFTYEYPGEVYKDSGDSSQGNYGSFAVGDIIIMALDLDNSKAYFGVNGTWGNSSDPTSGATGTGAISVTAADFWHLQVGDRNSSNTATYETNFGGCPAFTISSGNADGNGYGNFEYAVPSGYLALCTKNLGSDGG